MKISWKHLLLLTASVFTLAACGTSNTGEESTETSSSASVVPGEVTEGEPAPPADEGVEQIEATVNVTNAEGEEANQSGQAWHSDAGIDLYAFMQEHYKVQTEGGEIVDIKGFRPEEGQTWAYTANGEETGVPADEYIVQNGDVIDWTIVAE